MPDSTPLRCPKCETSPVLDRLRVDGIEVDRCPACDGIWFDRQELRELLDRDDRAVRALLDGSDDQDHDHHVGVCPRDGQKLLRVNSLRNHQVAIDCCFVCQGIWLDGGEFAQIKAASPKIRLGDLI